MDQWQKIDRSIRNVGSSTAPLPVLNPQLLLYKQPPKNLELILIELWYASAHFLEQRELESRGADLGMGEIVYDTCCVFVHIEAIKEMHYKSVRCLYQLC